MARRPSPSRGQAVRVAGLAAGLGLFTAGLAAGEERAPGAVPDGTPPAPAPLLLNLTNRPPETPARALQEAVREDARAPRASGPSDVEVLPDGSVRIGRTRIQVHVKDCPEDAYLDLTPRPPPGRSRR